MVCSCPHVGCIIENISFIALIESDYYELNILFLFGSVDEIFLHWLSTMQPISSVPHLLLIKNNLCTTQFNSALTNKV